MKKVEEMTIAELKEFAAKIDKVIPEGTTRKADIIKFLSGTKEEVKPPGPSENTKRMNQIERDKKASSIPLTEADKAYLAKLETMARSGKSPDLDQMKDLRILRRRKEITPLSIIEQRELEELKLMAEGSPIDSTNRSGLPDDERLADLTKRREL